MNEIIFIGTGAGDEAIQLQTIKNSCIYCELDSVKFVIDPAPGSLINLKEAGINIAELNGMFISHPDPDHSSDANAILTAFDRDGTFLFAEETCLKGNKDFLPCISKFHQTQPAEVFAMSHNSSGIAAHLKIETVEAQHYSPCVGFTIKGTRKISYVADGIYTEDNAKRFGGSDLMILNTFLPYNAVSSDYYVKQKHGVLHMTVEDAIAIVNIAKPKLAVIQHFSQKFLEADPQKQAETIEKNTGIRTIAAKDGMKIDLDSLETVG
jgi:ribonuclease BN (tRNA processing enzyme)